MMNVGGDAKKNRFIFFRELRAKIYHKSYWVLALAIFHMINVFSFAFHFVFDFSCIFFCYCCCCYLSRLLFSFICWHSYWASKWSWWADGRARARFFDDAKWHAKREKWNLKCIRIVPHWRNDMETPTRMNEWNDGRATNANMYPLKAWARHKTHSGNKVEMRHIMTILSMKMFEKAFLENFLALFFLFSSFFAPEESIT